MYNNSPEINEVITRLESSLTKFKNDIIEWMFLLWIAHVVVMGGLGLILLELRK